MTDTFDQTADTSAVTLEDLEAYLARNTRDILAPVMPGQNKVTGMFQSGTSGSAPPAAHVEGEGQPTPSNPPAADLDDDLITDDESADGVDAEETAGDNREVEPVVSDAPVVEAPPVTPAADLIEVSPGQFMTKEAISAALSSRSQQPQVAEVEQAPAVTTSAPVDIPEITLTQDMLDDPELGPMYRVIQAQQHAIAQQSQQLAFVSDIAVSRAQEELGARVTAGLNQFKEAKSLSDDQLTQINEVAVRLNVMGSLSSGIDPITGATVPRDPQSAAYRAMEIAYWQMPEYRDIEFQSQLQQRVTDQKRKRKLAGVSGGSGSVPRTTTVPSDRRGRENAAVTELRELMSPGSSEE